MIECGQELLKKSIEDIKNRKRNHDGTLVGKESINPILDTCIYNVEFLDGVVEEFPTNVLLENLYEQVDDDGLPSSHLNGISDYKFDETALKKLGRPIWEI